MSELYVEQNNLAVVYGPAIPEDAAAMRQIRGANWMLYARTPEEAAWMAGEVQDWCGPEGIAIEADRIASANEEPDSNFYFQTAKVDGALVGYAAGFRSHPEDGLHDVQELGALHVAQAATGHGIGSRLLGALFRDMGEAKPTVLDTVAGTKAVDFYTRHGFQEWDPEHPAEPWGPLTTIRMIKE